MRFNPARFLIPTVILLGCALFAVDLALPYVTFWAPYGLLLLLVYRWGRRQDIYPLATFYTLLVAIDGLRDFLYYSPEDTLTSQVLHVAVTWFIAWLLSQRMRTDEQLAQERASLEEQVHTRTAELEREVQVRRRLNEDLEARVARRTASLEQALADRQRALHLKSEFMAMISHELRTPLTGIITMAELLEQQIAGPINERQLAYVHTIQKSGARLLTVVNSIISYADLVSGDVQLQRAPCDLTYLLGLAAASLRAQAAAKQQTLDLTVDPPGLAIESDAEALVQVVKRLLDNAVKFTPAGGEVGVLAQQGPAPATVQIVVWDTGIGVPGADLASIVKPFTQADGSLTRPHEGVGMGLAYVDRMVALLGGRLDLEPNCPAGSRFIVTLPGLAA